MTMDIPGAGGKMILACSTGGHLTELMRLEERFGAHPDSIWVTFDTPQSRQRLAGRRVHHVPYVGPRDVKNTLRAIPHIRRLLKQERWDGAISTGAAIAVSTLPLAARSGVPSTYIESVCRLDGPSATGRLLQRVSNVRLRTQHPTWSSGRWRQHPSILSDYHSERVKRRVRERKLFITLGTIRGYRFDSVVDAVLRTGLADDDTVWQLGDTHRADKLPGRVCGYLSPADFNRAAAEADVVISHAGVGTLLELLAMGVYPVQAVRRTDRGEHVDDHQSQIARLVNDLDLGIAVGGPDVTAEVIDHAAGRRVVDGLRARVAEPAW